MFDAKTRNDNESLKFTLDLDYFLKPSGEHDRERERERTGQRETDRRGATIEEASGVSRRVRFNFALRAIHTARARDVTHKGTSFLPRLIVSLAFFFFSIERDALTVAYHGGRVAGPRGVTRRAAPPEAQFAARLGGRGETVTPMFLLKHR